MAQEITVEEIKARLDNGDEFKMIDVRTLMEYDQMHAPMVELYPLGEWKPEEVWQEMSVTEEEKLYIICQSGSRARQAASRFEDAGLKNIVVITGGTSAWAEAGLEMIKGRKRMSLERQVRIAAGSLVLTGVALGFGVHWGFFGISAFVGCGLVFAGVTDTCGMGIMLSKAPWNRVKDPRKNRAAQSVPGCGDKEVCELKTA